MSSPEVILAFMPYGHMRYPALGVSLLQSALLKEGISCKTEYFNIKWVAEFMQGPFAERIEAFHHFGNTWSYYNVAESCFAQHLFPNKRAELLAMVEAVEDKKNREHLLYGFDNSDSFLNACLQMHNWSEVKLVGFSTTFNQNLASLAFAKRLKENFPHLTIVFGGANVEGVMGESLCTSFPFIDYGFSGDADISFPKFAKAIINNKPAPKVPGLIFRNSASDIERVREVLIQDMDSLPYPNFEDYFSDRENSGLEEHEPVRQQRFVPFESSRGCWWGESQHCTFCGLNGLSMKFRAKSEERFLAEVQHVNETYSPNKVCAMDNIMDYRYLKSVLHKLRDLNLDLYFSYDVKSNLKKADLEVMAAAGIKEIEAGIESLSSASLKRMKKGVSAIRNVQTMRIARELDMKIHWQYLYGFPGETWEEHASVPGLIPKLFHLESPADEETSRVSIQRYSPLFSEAKSFGLINLRPHPSYHELYDLPAERIKDLAYRFEADYGPELPQSANEIEEALNPLLKKWIERDNQAADLALFRHEKQGIVLDTRLDAPRLILLDELSLALLDRACEIVGSKTLHKSFTTNEESPAELHEELEIAAQTFAHIGVPVYGIERADKSYEVYLNYLLDHALIMQEGEKFLSLVIGRSPQTLQRILEGLPKPPYQVRAAAGG
ncbi:MAG: hypothetical protein CMH60_02915 [Myxococcales bacterium]|nr:hypothetical protein [Myxococcales bacterium]